MSSCEVVVRVKRTNNFTHLSDRGRNSFVLLGSTVSYVHSYQTLTKLEKLKITLFHRVVQHKNHIEKAMYLTAMARPHQDPVTGVWWNGNGKIGTWFFVEQVPAKRTSKNQAARTLETKSVSVG